MGRAKSVPTAQRKLIVDDVLSGTPQVLVASVFQVHKSTISRIVKKFRETGYIGALPRSGRPRKTTDRDDALIISQSLVNPRLTAVDITKSIIAGNVAEISVNSVRRRLRAARLVAKNLLKKKQENMHSDYIRQKMPMIGIGTWQMKSERVLREVINAGLAAGYRFIDTAQVYGNECMIARILEDLLPKHNLTREDIFITSKVAPANAGSKKAAQSIDKSLTNLKTDYIDLMLIHWPGSGRRSEDAHNQVLREETWAVLADYKSKGKLKAIGVSNFEIKHLDQLPAPVPEVNQVEFHPKFHQKELLQYCSDRGIHFQAYSSLGSPAIKDELFADPDVLALTEKYETTPATLLLAWSLSQGISVLPRTTNKEHVVANFAATKLKISKDDCDTLLNNGAEDKTCWDPRPVN